MEEEDTDYTKLIEGEKNEAPEDTSGSTIVCVCSFSLVIYDEDGNPKKIAKVAINLVTAIQREESYPPIKKDFFPDSPPTSEASPNPSNSPSTEPSSTESLTAWKTQHGIEINNIASDAFSSSSPPKTPHPVLSFASLPFPAALQRSIEKQHFLRPTPIQSAALPLVLAGRDVIGSSPTGSGKTCCYLWPFILHAAAQP